MSSDEEHNNFDGVISDIEDENNDLQELGENLEENTEEVQRDENADIEGEENREEDEEKKVVKPKRTIRNPQPKLNEETLKGPRGIVALESYFERVKFKGKGHEHNDLNVIMKTYEYWCHRLFPKFPFDTCIERLEKLGTKRAVQVHIKRIRFDLLVEDKPIIDSSDEETNVDGFVDIQNDEINQQNQQFDQLLTASFPPDNETVTELSEEQLEKIRLNKERAEKLRQERLRKIRDRAEVNLNVSRQLPGTSGVDNEARVVEINSQSTQGDLFIQELQENILEESEFDLESTIKGKTIVKGSTVKKKSTKKLDRNDPIHSSVLQDVNSLAFEEDGKENKFSQRKVKKMGRLLDSDDEEVSERLESTVSDSPMNNDNNIENSVLLKNNTRSKKVIESDDSGNEDISRKANMEKSLVETQKTQRKVLHISDSDQSDQELDTHGVDPLNLGSNNKKINGVSLIVENNLLQPQYSKMLEAKSRVEPIRENDEPMEVFEGLDPVLNSTEITQLPKNKSDSSHVKNKENTSVDNIS